MVAQVKIYKGETPAEELQQAFTDEMTGIMKDAALKLNCSPEELKYRIDNLGRVEVRRMTLEEIVLDSKQREMNLRKKEIRRIKGID